MIDKIEVFTSTKHLLSEPTFNSLVDLVLLNGFKSLALHGCYLKTLSETKIKPDTSLTLEYPFCQNDSAIRSVMVDAYITLYGDLFKTINISPQSMYFVDDSIFNVVEDLTYLADATLQLKKKLRIILDLSCFPDASSLFKYIDNVQSTGIDEIIIGASLSKERNLNDILEVIEGLESSIDMPISFFGKLSHLDDVHKLAPFNFSSILIPHNNLVNLLKK